VSSFNDLERDCQKVAPVQNIGFSRGYYKNVALFYFHFPREKQQVFVKKVTKVFAKKLSF
jgi:hypothetical protein